MMITIRKAKNFFFFDKSKMISAPEGLSMMTTTSKAIHIAIAMSITIQAVISTSQRVATAMQKKMSIITEFTASKHDIFHNVKRDRDNDSKRSLNNDNKNNDKSESNRDDDDEIEKK